MAEAAITDEQHKIALVVAFDSQCHLSDPQIRLIYDSLINLPNPENEKFCIRENLLCCKETPHDAPEHYKLVVPKNQCHLLLQLAHDDQVYGGHLGVRKTLRKLRSYWWPGMSNDVAQYVRTCDICQRFKQPKGPKIGKLHPIPVSKLFERLHIDIVGPVHSSTLRGNKYISTEIDAYSRFAFAQANPDSRTDFCLDFLESIIAIHDTPTHIVSDQGPQFMSVQWADAMRKHGIKHNRTNPYHPQSNGMDERLNGSLAKILKAYTVEKPNTWDVDLK